MSKQFKKSKEHGHAVMAPPKDVKPVNISSTQSSEPKLFLIFILFFILTLVLYGNTLNNGYSMDDELVTLNQPNVEAGFSGIPKILTARYSINNKQHYEYRPTVLLTFAIEYQFFGRDPAASHFINMLFYAFTSLLVYLIIKKIFYQHHWILALLTGLIFLIHPMHSEVAASLKNRDEMLALIFALFALSAFINYADKLKWKYIVYGFIFFFLAVFSKKSAFPFIAIIPFVIIFTRKVNPYKVIGLTVLVVLVTTVTGKIFLNNVLDREDTLREMFFFENPLYTGVYSFGDKLMMSLATLGYYIKMMFVPYPLVSYYGYNTIEGFDFGLNHVIGLLAIFAILFVSYKYFKTNKPLVLGIVMFCISISMFANLAVPAVGIVAERFAFEASIGFCLVLASVILMFSNSFNLSKAAPFSEVAKKNKSAFYMTLIVMCIASAIVVIPRNPAWKSTSSLYHTDAKVMPTSTKLFSLLGTIHTNLLNSHVKGDTGLTANALMLHSDTAISYFKKALDIYPDYIAVNNNLGTVYFTFKPMLDSAGFYFERACQLDTDYVEAYFNMGNFYDQKAEFTAQKLSWINSVLVGADTAVDKNDKRQTTKILDAYDPVFFKLISLKTQLVNVYNKVVTGQSKGDPKASVLDALLYFYKEMKSMRTTEIDHMGLADGIIKVFQASNKNQKPNQTTISIDSTVNHYYFPAITKMLLKEGKIEQADLNSTLRYNIRMELRKYRKECILHLKKSMRLNPEYMTAYTKLTQVLSRWSMFDELIAVEKLALKNPKYKSYSINLSLADAYFSKGDYKSTAKYFIIGLKELERVTKRINNVINNFSKANNNFMVTTLLSGKENNKAHLSNYINKFMYQISNRYANETVQIQQLYNMIKSI